MTPGARILANGADATAAILDRLIQLKVRDEAGFKSDVLEISIDNRDGAVAAPPKGREIEVFLGYKEKGLIRQGLFVADEVTEEGPPDKISVKCRGANLRDSLKARKARNFDAVTIGDLVATIAAEHGYTPRVGSSLAAVQLAHVDQTGESDMHLLTRLAQERDAVVKYANGMLIFAPAAEAKSISGQALTPISLTRKDISTYRRGAPDRGRYGSVTAYYHDRATAQRTAVTVGENAPVFTLRNDFPDAQSAQTAAEAKMQQLNRRGSDLYLTLPGLPEAAAEAPLRLSGLPAAYNGDWIIKVAEHTYRNDGFTTTIEAEAAKS